MNYFIVILLISIPTLVAEAVNSFGARRLVTRKLAHVLGSITAALLPFLISLNEALVVAAVGFALMAVVRYTNRLNAVSSRTDNSIGELLFPLGAGLAVVFIWPVSTLAYSGACLLLGFADGLAGYVGERSQSKLRKIVKRKTALGSMTFFVVSLAVFALVLWWAGALSGVSISGLILASILITLTEVVFSGGYDNLFIPTVAGFLLILLGL